MANPVKQLEGRAYFIISLCLCYLHTEWWADLAVLSVSIARFPCVYLKESNGRFRKQTLQTKTKHKLQKISNTVIFINKLTN